jgi:ABC-type sugar transport system permease subunit
LRVDLLPYFLFLPALVAIGAILFYPVVQAILISLRSYYLPSASRERTPFCGLPTTKPFRCPEFPNALLFNVVLQSVQWLGSTSFPAARTASE